jgi:hypothetical protein
MSGMTTQKLCFARPVDEPLCGTSVGGFTPKHSSSTFMGSKILEEPLIANDDFGPTEAEM